MQLIKEWCFLIAFTIGIFGGAVQNVKDTS